MYSYIARQPILNLKLETVGFELLFRDGQSNSFPEISGDKATSKIIVDNQFTLGINEVTGNLPGFINFNDETLIHNFPFFLDPKDIVVEILEDVVISESLLVACKQLKRKGYTLALDDYNFDPKWDVFFPYVDIIKVDVYELNIADIKQHLPRLAHLKTAWLAEKVETYQEFDELKKIGFTLFQGYFFAKPETIKKKNILSSKQHLIQLLEHSSKADFDFDAISQIFSSDLGLTYKLLRFINSPSYGPSKEISSLKHALIYIGAIELKKFIALLVLADLNENKPNEIIRVSLTRAKFCEQMSDINDESDNPPKAFLAGMLSHIDGVLDQHMDDVMRILPLHEEIKKALTKRDNYLAKYLELSLSLEQGNWMLTKIVADSISVRESAVLDAYQDAMTWTDNMLDFR